LRYTGREFDSETGLLYNRARYFDTGAGRFLAEDPIRYRAGVNFYAYTRNNPVVLTDPFGYQECNAEQWAQSPNPCAGPQDLNAPDPYLGHDMPVLPPDPTPSTPPSPSSNDEAQSTPYPNACPCKRDEPRPANTLEALVTTFSHVTHPLDMLAVNASIFVASGAQYLASGIVISGGCLEPTPFEPVTCAAGAFAGGVTFTSGTGTAAFGVWFFENQTLPALKGKDCD
jgi:RHS repeat-associated protein